jgi:hypothetical protein
MNNQPSFSPQRHTDTNRIKIAFRSQILKESAMLILKKQNEVVDLYDLFESGSLKRSLQGHFSVSDINSGSQLTMRYLTYFRFLDMADSRRRNREWKREGYHLYNKIMFGYLYKQTMPQLKYGFTEENKTLIRNMIIENLAGGNIGMRNALILTDMSSEGDRNAMAIISRNMRQGYRW